MQIAGGLALVESLGGLLAGINPSDGGVPGSPSSEPPSYVGDHLYLRLRFLEGQYETIA